MKPKYNIGDEVYVISFDGVTKEIICELPTQYRNAYVTDMRIYVGEKWIYSSYEEAEKAHKFTHVTKQ